MEQDRIITHANARDQSSWAYRSLLRRKAYVINETASLIILPIASALAAGLLLLPVTLPGATLILAQDIAVVPERFAADMPAVSN